MKVANIFLIAFLTVGLFGTTAFGADVAKIGMIDFQRIMDISDAGKRAKAEVEKKGREFEETLREKGEQIKQDQNNFQRESLVMNAQMREEKNREIRIKINDFKEMQQNLRKELNEFQAQIIKEIETDVRGIVDEIGKKEGYLLILESRSAGVVYMPDSLDITDRVVQQYNKNDKAKSGKKG